MYKKGKWGRDLDMMLIMVYLVAVFIHDIVLAGTVESTPCWGKIVRCNRSL